MANGERRTREFHKKDPDGSSFTFKEHIPEAPPEHRGPSDEQIMQALQQQGGSEALSQSPGSTPMGSSGGGFGSFLFEPRETPAGKMNFLQALGMGFQDVGRGLQGQEQVLPQMATRRTEQAQQQQQFERQLQAAMERLQTQLTAEKGQRDLDRELDVFRETGVIGAKLKVEMESGGFTDEQLGAIAKTKFSSVQAAADQKRFEAMLSEEKVKAIKDPKTRDVALGLVQPDTPQRIAMMKWFTQLSPKVQAQLAPMVLGGMTAEQMLLAIGLDRGMKLEDIISLIRTGEADPELAALTKLATALATAQAGGVPISDELMRDFGSIMKKLFEKLKIKREPSKADVIGEAKAGAVLDTSEIIREWRRQGGGGGGVTGPPFPGTGL